VPLNGDEDPYALKRIGFYKKFLEWFHLEPIEDEDALGCSHEKSFMHYDGGAGKLFSYFEAVVAGNPPVPVVPLEIKLVDYQTPYALYGNDDFKRIALDNNSPPPTAI